MTKERMTRTQMEALAICKDCRYFHRYRLRSLPSYHEEGIPEDQVEVYEEVNTYSRCLVGGAQLPPMDLTECIVLDCNQFERREEKGQGHARP